MSYYKEFKDSFKGVSAIEVIGEGLCVLGIFSLIWLVPAIMILFMEAT